MDNETNFLSFNKIFVSLRLKISKKIMTKSKTASSKAVQNRISSKFAVEVSDLLIGDKTSVTGYHTQECRPEKLKQPIGVSESARLGIGHYFWLEEDFAHHWGRISKTNGGSYDVYTADLNIKNSLNTVFNEEGYLFFRKMIKRAIQHLQKINVNVTLEKVNRFLADYVWKAYNISCIIYDDKPTNKPKKKLIYSEIPDLYYNKRIQIAVFDLEDISNFALYLENQKPT